MRGDKRAQLGSEPLAQLVGDPFGHASGVDEHQRGPVPADVLRDPVQDLRHLLAGGHRAQLVVGNLQRQVQLPAVPGIHDRAPRRPVGVVAVLARAHQQTRDRRNRPHGGRQPHPLHRPLRDVREPLQGQGQVRAALVRGDGMDFIHDHGPGGAQHGPAPLRGHQQEQRLGGGDQDVGRVLEHGRPLGRRRVAGPDRHPYRRRGQPEFPGHRRDLPQRRLEVLLDVRGQRLQRRHVHHLRARPRLSASPIEPVDDTPGMRPASYPTRSAPRSACACPPRFPATRPPAARSARPGTAARTRRAPRDGTTRAPAHRTSGPRHSAPARMSRARA